LLYLLTLVSKYCRRGHVRTPRKVSSTPFKAREHDTIEEIIQRNKSKNGSTPNLTPVKLNHTSCPPKTDHNLSKTLAYQLSPTAVTTDHVSTSHPRHELDFSSTSSSKPPSSKSQHQHAPPSPGWSGGLSKAEQSDRDRAALMQRGLRLDLAEVKSINGRDSPRPSVTSSSQDSFVPTSEHTPWTGYKDQEQETREGGELTKDSGGGVLDSANVGLDIDLHYESSNEEESVTDDRSSSHVKPASLIQQQPRVNTTHRSPPSPSSSSSSLPLSSPAPIAVVAAASPVASSSPVTKVNNTPTVSLDTDTACKTITEEESGKGVDDEGRAVSSLKQSLELLEADIESMRECTTALQLDKHRAVTKHDSETVHIHTDITSWRKRERSRGSSSGDHNDNDDDGDDDIQYEIQLEVRHSKAPYPSSSSSVPPSSTTVVWKSYTDFRRFRASLGLSLEGTSVHPSIHLYISLSVCLCVCPYLISACVSVCVFLCVCTCVHSTATALALHCPMSIYYMRVHTHTTIF
jgi:hypothetical protein